MKTILFFCIIISLGITSCSDYRLYIEIEPEIYIVGDSVGLKYMLNDHIISHELNSVSPEKLQYIKDNKDNIKFNAIIEYDGFDQEIKFVYYIKGIKISTNYLEYDEDLIETIKITVDKENKKESVSSKENINMKGNIL